MGFEPTPVFTDQNAHFVSLYFKLESGALDRSATLTYTIAVFENKFMFDLFKNFLIFKK